MREKAGLGPAELRGAVREARQLPDGVKRHQRIIGAGLNRDVASGLCGLELIAIEFRQVDERRRPLVRQAIPVHAVLGEKPGAKAEGKGEPGGREAERRAAIGPLDRNIPAQVAGGLAGAHSRRRKGPKPQHCGQLVPRLGETIERGEVAVRLLAGFNSALMEAEEGFLDWGPDLRRGGRGAADICRHGAGERASHAGEQTATGWSRSLSREWAAHFAKTSVLFSSSTK